MNTNKVTRNLCTSWRGVLVPSIFVISISNAAMADYAGSVLADNPIGYWRLGEVSGATAMDASPNHLNGNYVGNVLLGQPGAIATDSDTSVAFDGSTAYVDVGSHAILNHLTNDFTVEAWIMGKGPIASTWLTATPSREASGFGFSVPFDPKLGTSSPYDSVLRFTTFGIQDYDYPIEFTAERWYYVAAVFDSSDDATFYIDGEEVATIPGSLPARTNSQSLHIGEAADGVFYFSGNIDEVAIYGRSLSSEAIRRHYLDATLPEPSTVMLLFGGVAILLPYYRHGHRSLSN